MSYIISNVRLYIERILLNTSIAIQHTNLRDLICPGYTSCIEISIYLYILKSGAAS